ncbi:hypothetical protein D018_4591A, partial [Vibrio parahaemolyticus VP2007-007]
MDHPSVNQTLLDVSTAAVTLAPIAPIF